MAPPGSFELFQIKRLSGPALHPDEPFPMVLAYWIFVPILALSRCRLSLPSLSMSLPPSGPTEPIMIVCVCNCLSEADCERAAAARSVDAGEDLHAAMGVAVCCGRCLPTMEAIIDEVRARHEREQAARAAAELLDEVVA
jgi:bacterioferritin-associated ferredoxin